MLTRYVRAATTQAQLRSGLAGPFLDAFIEHLETKGLAGRTVRNYLGSLSHFSRWADERGLVLGAIDGETLEELRRHPGQCRCFPGRQPEECDRLVERTRSFLRYLGVEMAPRESASCTEPDLLVRFRQWMVEHRGVAPGTLRLYEWPLRRFLDVLGEPPHRVEVAELRRCLSEYCQGRGSKAVEAARTALRMLLRFEAAEGRCPAGFEDLVLERLRRAATPTQLDEGLLGPFLGGFLQRLESLGLAGITVANYRVETERFNRWATKRGLPLDRLDKVTTDGYLDDLRNIRGIATVDQARRTVRCFLGYLREQGVPVPASPPPAAPPPEPLLLESFRAWMTRHRGVTQTTLDIYARPLRELLTNLGEDPSRYEARGLTTFLLDYQRRHGRRGAQHAVSAMRMFLRHLAADGRCEAGLAAAIPPVVRWRLSSLPRYLKAEEVERILGVCDTSTAVGLRDRAVLLLLARLSLRAGDILGLRLNDIDSEAGSLRLSGKGRREVRLPLTQEIGDALVAYLERGRPAAAPYDRLFLGTRLPVRPWARSSAVSDLVARCIRRAGVCAVLRGAHVLRHSAATEMLRQGASLDDIGAVLRHRFRDTTAIYAKVDVALLKLVAQPWPEVSSC